MLRRSAASRFAPGFVVFPGGAVEAEDERLARDWFGDPHQAARACAVRELAEETGLALTRSGLRALGPGEDPVAAVSQSPPPRRSLVEVARWLAPEFLAVRFDATFFATRAAAGLAVRPDGVEADRSWWARPAELLHTYDLYEALMWPTYRTLEELATCRSTDDVLRLSMAQESPPAAGSSRSPEWRAPGGEREDSMGGR